MSVFVEVLEWTTHGPAEMAHRLPEEGSADIRMGAQLIVQENQAALFFRDGKCLDTLGPGRHVLSTLNLPILTRALSLPYGFQSPFRASICFVNQKIFTDLKWGTKNPVVFRDRDLGIVRLRGYGRFGLRVAEPQIFVNTLMGSRANYLVTELEDFFRDLVVARLNDLLGEKQISLYDLPALYNELGASARILLRPEFRRYGLDLVEFYVNSITPPENVQKMIDERSSMEAVGDLNSFLRFQAARAVGGHGGNGGDGDGSAAGSAMEAGLGAGLGIGLVPKLLREGLRDGGAGGLDPGSLGQERAPHAFCTDCGRQLPEDARFCPACGKEQRGESREDDQKGRSGDDERAGSSGAGEPRQASDSQDEQA